MNFCGKLFRKWRLGEMEMETMGWEQYVRKVTPYVPGEQPGGQNIIKLNTNECPYPPAPGVQERLRTMDASAFRLYPAPDAGPLEKALCERYEVTPDQLFIGVGSDDVLAMAFLTFFHSEKPILFPDVTYSFYPVWAELYRIPFEKKPLDQNFRIVKEDYMGENGGVILPNPNAPTGILESVSVLEEIIAANPDSVVIIDEAYVDFGGESCRKLIHKYDNLLVVQTFSKSRSMAGMRIGFAMGSPRLIGYLKDAKFSFNSYTMNMPSIELGIASVKDQAYFEDVVGRIICTRERMKEELRTLGFSFPDAMGNFIFARHERVPAGVIFEELKKQGIYVRYWNQDRISDYLRITIGTDEEMDVFLEKLKQILAAFGSEG